MAKRTPAAGRPDPGGPLDNYRHEMFLQEYISADGDAVLAYRRCYPKVTTDHVARKAAARLLNSVAVRQRLRKLWEKRARRYAMDADKAIRELQMIAHADPADVFDFTAPRKADGFVALRTPNSIRGDARRAIAAVRSTPVVVNGRVRYKTEVRFHDKGAALDKLLRAYGLYRELSDVETFLAGLPPKLRDRMRREIARETGAADPSAGPEPARWEPLAVTTSGGPDAPDGADGADPGAVAAGPPDLPEEADGGPVPPGGGVDDLGGLDLSKLFDDL